MDQYKNELYMNVQESLMSKGFNYLGCMWEMINGFEINDNIGFGHSFMVDYIDQHHVSLIYRDIDDQDNSKSYGVIPNEMALDIINKCLDAIVLDSE